MEEELEKVGGWEPEAELYCVMHVGCGYNGVFHSLKTPRLPCLPGVQRRQSRAGVQEDRGASPEVSHCRADER